MGPFIRFLPRKRVLNSPHQSRISLRVDFLNSESMFSGVSTRQARPVQTLGTTVFCSQRDASGLQSKAQTRVTCRRELVACAELFTLYWILRPRVIFFILWSVVRMSAFFERRPLFPRTQPRHIAVFSN